MEDDPISFIKWRRSQLIFKWQITSGFFIPQACLPGMPLCPNCTHFKSCNMGHGESGEKGEENLK